MKVVLFSKYIYINLYFYKKIYIYLFYMYSIKYYIKDKSNTVSIICYINIDTLEYYINNYYKNEIK